MDRILIIEDDPTLLRGLKDNFELEGYAVDTAADGPSGLEAAMTARADLILLDVMMPRMNGFEICQRLRAANIQTAIIMLTAKGEEDDIVRGLNLGADDYVTKPFSIRELLARVNAFLRRRREPAQQVFEFGRCGLDLAARTLSRNGEEVELTPKEFELLKLFVSRIGCALTRDEIMRQVWGSDILVTRRSVDRCVTTLRSKIEDDPKEPTFIQTVRDFGYRFDTTGDDDSSGNK